jgi:hypothetical protein
VNEIDQPWNKTSVRAKRSMDFDPFEGHQSRLGHYYRHLYQTIAYIDRQRIPINRYEYAKTVRAQLSTHEQALLLLNSQTPMGQAWWMNRFVVDYQMVKNIPQDFFDSDEISLPALFSPGYFEWEKANHEA